jgi:hypothetical protein
MQDPAHDDGHVEEGYDVASVAADHDDIPARRERRNFQPRLRHDGQLAASTARAPFMLQRSRSCGAQPIPARYAPPGYMLALSYAAPTHGKHPGGTDDRMPGRANDFIEIPDAFWQRSETLAALRDRNIGRLFALIGQYAGASQTQIGIACGMAQLRAYSQPLPTNTDHPDLPHTPEPDTTFYTAWNGGGTAVANVAIRPVPAGVWPITAGTWDAWEWSNAYRPDVLGD